LGTLGWRKWGEREKGEEVEGNQEAEGEKTETGERTEDGSKSYGLGGSRSSLSQQLCNSATLASLGGQIPQTIPSVSDSNTENPHKNDDAGVLPSVQLWEIRPGKAVDKPFSLRGEMGTNVHLIVITDSGACVNALDSVFYEENSAALGPLDAPDFEILVADGRKVRPLGALTTKLSLPHKDGPIRAWFGSRLCSPPIPGRPCWVNLG
jgi:hypothetical protein